MGPSDTHNICHRLLLHILPIELRLCYISCAKYFIYFGKSNAFCIVLYILYYPIIHTWFPGLYVVNADFTAGWGRLWRHHIVISAQRVIFTMQERERERILVFVGLTACCTIFQIHNFDIFVSLYPFLVLYTVRLSHHCFDWSNFWVK